MSNTIVNKYFKFVEYDNAKDMLEDMMMTNERVPEIKLLNQFCMINYSDYSLLNNIQQYLDIVINYKGNEDLLEYTKNNKIFNSDYNNLTLFNTPLNNGDLMIVYKHCIYVVRNKNLKEDTEMLPSILLGKGIIKTSAEGKEEEQVIFDMSDRFIYTAPLIVNKNNNTIKLDFTRVSVLNNVPNFLVFQELGLIKSIDTVNAIESNTEED